MSTTRCNRNFQSKQTNGGCAGAAHSSQATQAPHPGPSSQVPSSPALRAPSSQGPQLSGSPALGAPSIQGPTSQSPQHSGPYLSGPPAFRAPSIQGLTSQGPTFQGPQHSGPPAFRAPAPRVPSSQGPSSQGPSSQGPSSKGPSSQGPNTSSLVPTQYPGIVHKHSRDGTIHVLVIVDPWHSWTLHWKVGSIKLDSKPDTRYKNDWAIIFV